MFLLPYQSNACAESIFLGTTQILKSKSEAAQTVRRFYIHTTNLELCYTGEGTKKHSAQIVKRLSFYLPNLASGRM